MLERLISPGVINFGCCDFSPLHQIHYLTKIWVFLDNMIFTSKLLLKRMAPKAHLLALFVFIGN
jgi:hypothetical protein